MAFPHLRLRDEVAAPRPALGAAARGLAGRTSRSASCRSARRGTSSASSSRHRLVRPQGAAAEVARTRVRGPAAPRRRRACPPSAPSASPSGTIAATAILVTEYLRHSHAVPAPADATPPGPPAYRDRLLDAMALLLVDLHRGGVYWGDCSLANTLFRRDGDRIQAYLVDAETSEVHPTLLGRPAPVRPRHPRRERRLRPRRPRALPGREPRSVDDARSTRPSPSAPATTRVWDELYDQPELIPGDRQAIRARLRRLNDLGFSVDLEVDPVPAGGARPAAGRRVTTRRTTRNELERRTRLRDARGAGAHPAQRPRRVPRLARVVRTAADRRRARPPTLAARGLPADARADHRAVGPDRDLSRRTATCSSTSGSCLRRSAVTSGCGPPSMLT